MTIDSALFFLLLLLALVSSEISVAYFAAGLLAVLWFVGRRRDLARSFANPPTALAAAYVLLVLCSAAFSRDPSRSLKALPGLTIFLLLPITMDLVRTRRQGQALCAAVATNGVAVSVIGLLQFSRSGSDMHNRIRGSVSHYMTFSALTMIAGCLLLAMAMEERGRRRWMGALAVIPFVAMLLTFTRGVYVGSLVAIAAYLLLRRPRGLLLFVPAVLLIYLALPRDVQARVRSVADLSDETARDRIAMNRAAVRMVRDWPVMGLGPEMVKPYYMLYRDPDAPRWRVPHLHSNLLQTAAASGIFAALAYLALMSLFLARAAVVLRRAPPGPAGVLAAGPFLVGVALFFSGFFEYNFGDTEVLIPTLLLMGMTFSYEGQD